MLIDVKHDRHAGKVKKVEVITKWTWKIDFNVALMREVQEYVADH